ncbi:MAG: S9 family peptidase [Gemmatimonadota bacterium]
MHRAPIFIIAFVLASTLATDAASQALAASTASQGDLRPLALEDHYLLRDVGSPRISPEGGWVTYTVSTPVEETNDDVVATWIVPADGSAPPARVTHEGLDVSEPRWAEGGLLRYTAPDSTLWLVSPERPAGPADLDRSTEPSGIVSPDGRWRAVTRKIPTPAESQPTRTAFERRHEDRFEGVQLDWYPFVRNGQPFPLPDPRHEPSEEIFLEPVDGGEARQLTRLGLRPDDLAWRADGSALLFTADEAVLDELAYGRPDLFLVTTEGEVTRLTDDGYSYSGLGFSPNGRWISYVRSYGTDFIIDRELDHGGPRDLYVRPADGGEPVNLTVDWDLDAGSPMWSPDSGHIYFTTGIGGATHLFRVAPTGGPVEQVTTGERRIQGLDIDDAFERMTYTVGVFDRPADVWTADIDGGNERRLTDVHADFLGEIATSPAERIQWQSYDGTAIEGFLLHPQGYDPQGGPYPLIVMNHGGPHAASGYGFNFKNQLFAAHGYFVFLPNFRSSTGYGDDFKWATWGGWGTLDGEDVLAGVDHLIERLPVDPERVGTTGHSYGGILTNWLITRYPDRFKAAISGAGASNWTSNYAHSDVARTKETEFFGRPWEPRAREIMIRQSAYLNSGGVRTPTLFVHGEVDYRVPLEGSIQLYTSLKKQRVPAKLIIYEGMPHGIRGHWNVVHRMMHELDWWETYLK